VAATYVTEAQLRTALGIGTLYSDADVESCCATAEELLNSYLWFDSFPIVGVSIQGGTATALISAQASFTSGQSVTITNTGTKYNGTHTITSTWPWSIGSGTFPYFSFFPYNRYTFPAGYCLIQWNTNESDEYYRQVIPYGKASGIDTKQTSYANTPAINQAALMLAIDIWQARQSSNATGISPDFQPSPYRMGRSLLSRISALIAPYTSPRSMVG
jgi:hypothetical protein